MFADTEEKYRVYPRCFPVFLAAVVPDYEKLVTSYEQVKAGPYSLDPEVSCPRSRAASLGRYVWIEFVIYCRIFVILL